jgi:anti-anti-sigma factor
MLLEITPVDDPFGFSLLGEIDMATSPALNSALSAAMEVHLPVTLDMSDVSFLDSSGLRVILTCAIRHASNGSVTVVIQDPSPAVKRVIEILGVEGIHQLHVTTTADHHG